MRHLAILLSLVAGCSWSSFDDLEGEMWVDSVGSAEGVTTNDFIGVAAPGTTGQNAVFVALGRSDDSVGAYDYDTDGKRATEGVQIRAGTLQFGPLSQQAVIAGDPYSNFVGVAAVTGAANEQDTKIANFPADGVTAGVVQNDFANGGVLAGNIQATGLVYAQTDDDGVGTTTTDAVLARGPQIAMVTDYASTTTQALAGCFGATSNDVVLSVASGAFDSLDADDELVAVVNDAVGTAPQIVVFNGSAVTTTWTMDTTALNTCFDDGIPARATLARINGPAGDSSFGSRMVVGDFDGDGDPDIAVSSPDDAVVTAFINNALVFTEVDVTAPAEAGGFGGALAAGDLDGDGADELVVGADQATVEGTTNAGLVAVYSFNGTSFDAAMDPLRDLEPEVEQRFGIAVAVVAFGGANMLVAAADHELFAYFRTQMYADVRQ
jgi:hypothetical protein